MKLAFSWRMAVIAALLGLHLFVIRSVLFDEKPVIHSLHNDTLHRIGKAADFYAVYHAGVNCRNNVSPYLNNPDGITPYFYPFRYLPTLAHASAYLTGMSPGTAYRMWVVVLELLLAALLIVLYRRYADKTLWLGVYAMLVLSSPYFLESFMGQFTFASVTLFALGLLGGGSPVLWSASLLLKPLCLAAAPAVLRDRRYVVSLVIAVCAIIALSGPHFLSYPADQAVFMEVNFHPTGGLDSGNYGMVRLLDLLVNDLRIRFVAAHWDFFASSLRALLLALTAGAVLLSRTKTPVPGVCALLLAHFLTYAHVWEHHMSAVLVVAALMLSMPDPGRGTRAAILLSMLFLALPTPYALFDHARDAAVWDPAVTWHRSASYLILLPKVLPTIVLFGAAFRLVTRSGLHTAEDVVNGLKSLIEKGTGSRSR